jgi:mono/diheme cytochrome c family protein
MPAWKDILRADEIEALALYLTKLSPLLRAPAVAPVILPRRPENFEASDVWRARGQAVYRRLQCDLCHGQELRGDGPVANALRSSDAGVPYDLTVRPPAGGVEHSELVRTLALGLDGTPMPGFANAATAEELWALAEFLRSKVALDERRVDAVAIAPQASAAFERTGRAWPDWQGLTPDEAMVVAQPIPPQAPDPSLSPTEASLDARQCGRCHARQYADWRSSVHARAMGPGVWSRFFDMERRDVGDCQVCHAPLAEQLPDAGPFSPINAARADAITCAACHVRDHRRFGPPLVNSPARIRPLRYPLTTLAVYERSDFCLPCHQQGPDNAPSGRPFLNTYREWLESPAFRRGYVCQSCHMPDRDHTWKGAHDLETVRQAVNIEVVARLSDGRVTAEVAIQNVGAGHFFPTTQTPAAFVKVHLSDAKGRPIRGSLETHRVGRLMKQDGEGSLVDVSDTRIPPGESVRIKYNRKAAKGMRLEVDIEWHPDSLYEDFYRLQLEDKQVPEARKAYESALKHALDNWATLYRASIHLADGVQRPFDPGKGP